jgi:hypothetical protein
MDRKEGIWAGIVKRPWKMKCIMRQCAVGHTCTQGGKKLLENADKSLEVEGWTKKLNEQGKE